MIVTIIFGALLFGYFMSLTQMTGAMLEWIEAAGLPPMTVLLMVVGIYLILGMFMDQFALIVRSEAHTSELQSLMRISYAVFCLQKTLPPSHHTYSAYPRAAPSARPARHHKHQKQPL